MGLDEQYQIANIILPLDSEFKKFADEYERDNAYYLSTKDKNRKRGGGQRVASTFVPLSSEAYVDDVVRKNLHTIQPANQNRMPAEISPEVHERITE